MIERHFIRYQLLRRKRDHMRRLRISVSTFVLILGLQLFGNAAEPILKPGDTVALVGGTFIERAQIHGYFEAELLARTTGSISVRNLGWSGDNVLGESRAVFGDIANGYKRLLNDHKIAKPTVTLICYGANEAHGGKDGLEAFEQNLRRLISDLSNNSPRIVIVAPREYEYLGPPLPSPVNYNKSLAVYTQLQKEIAKELGLPFIDLATVSPIKKLMAGKRLPDVDPYTSNGVHLTEYGYWCIADQMVSALGFEPNLLRLDINVDAMERNSKGLQLTIKESRTPHLAPPKYSPDGVMPPKLGSLSVRGLPKGEYEVLIDNVIVAAANSKKLSSGVELVGNYDGELSSQIRYQIVDKNLLFFHRHRPQNETYLFLFRKHEQGNNAVEVEQFEPLIEAADKRLAKLTAPSERTLTIRIAK